MGPRPGPGLAPRLPPPPPGPGPCLGPESVAGAGANRRVNYQKSKVRALEEQRRQDGTPDQRARALELMWFVRAGMSSTLISARSLAQTYRDFGLVDITRISASTIYNTRNAWADLSKQLSRDHIADSLALFANTSMHPGVILKHIHDEAPMRLRSFLPAAEEDGGVKRAPYSKIQNNVVTATWAGQTAEWIGEMQALAGKTAEHIATALIGVVGEFMAALDARDIHRQIRVVHLVTGDGVGTNQAACKRLLWHFKHTVTSAKWVYFLVVFVCASHSANLAISTAICNGKGVKQAEDNDPVCCNCSRLFKHLMPAYIQEFGANLRVWVRSRASVTPCDEAEACASTQRLVDLYGSDAIPPDLTKVINGEFALLECRGRDLDRTAVCRHIYRALFDHLFRCDEKPVVTRFFTFADCCFCLLRLFLFKVPQEVFDLAGSSEEVAPRGLVVTGAPGPQAPGSQALGPPGGAQPPRGLRPPRRGGLPGPRGPGCGGPGGPGAPAPAPSLFPAPWAAAPSPPPARPLPPPREGRRQGGGGLSGEHWQ